MKFGFGLFVFAIFQFWLVASSPAQTVTFDFDSGTPALSTGQGIPFNQTSAGVTASISSPSGSAFSVQTDSSTGWRMSQFSGHYLYDNNQNTNLLDIQFSQPVVKVSLTFATADFQQVEVPTTVQLTAYVNAPGSSAVGTATAHGTYASDTMPMGVLTFDSGGRPFSSIEFGIQPGQRLGASAFFVDNVVVVPATSGTLNNVSAATQAATPMAPGSIANAIGSNLASIAESATAFPLPTMLANRTVTLKDSAGVELPAPLFYAGPSQINYVVPDGAAPGPATVTVRNGVSVVATGAVTIAAVAPGLFTANSDGKGAPAAEAVLVAADSTQTFVPVAQCGTTLGSCVPVPVDLAPSATVAVVLCLYGTGIRGYSTAVTATVGGLDAKVLYAGAQNQYIGLDQVNVLIPYALAGRGEVDLALAADGKAANTVRVNIK